MVKHCCAVGCRNTYQKGSGIRFYRFPMDPERKGKWISAVNHKGWMPLEHSWICSEHFVRGAKSNNPLAPNCVLTVFSHVESPVKQRMEGRINDFHRRQALKRRCTSMSSTLAISQETANECRRCSRSTNL